VTFLFTAQIAPDDSLKLKTFFTHDYCLIALALKAVYDYKVDRLPYPYMDYYSGLQLTADSQ